MPRSSRPSSTCRFDWRPSRWLVGALGLLAVLAAAGLYASALPDAWRSVLAPLVLALGLVRAAWEWRRPRLSLDWGPGGLRVSDALGRQRVVVQPQLREQGPLLCLSGRDQAGRDWRAAWWPDTLPRPLRRELRLLASVSHRPANSLPTVAA